jgi:hypothetical protein
METFKKHIETIKKTTQKYNEVELRLGSFTHNASPRFVSDTTKEAFDRVFTFVTAHGSFLREKHDLVTLLPQNKRIIQAETNVVYEKKTKVLTLDEPDYSFRVAVSHEEPVTEKECQGIQPDLVKDRKRYIFTRGNLVFFFTIYKLRNMDDNVDKFNIEIEFDVETVSQKDMDFLENVFKAYHDTAILVPESFKKEALKCICSIFKLKKYKNLFNQPLPIDISTINFEEEYGVSLKLDGLRKALFFYKGYMISFNPSRGNDYQFNVVTKTSITKTYLFDTEWYDNMYHIFDILVFEGKDVTNASLRERIALYEGLHLRIKNVKTKKHFIGKNLYKMSINILNFKDNKAMSDGLIYTSSKGYFNTVMKYKYQTTIDFQYQQNQGKTVLLVKDKEGLQTFAYKDTVFSFNKKNQFQGIPENSIVECYYDNVEKDFYPLRIRHDKAFPNYKDVAKDNFQHIVEPFDLRYFVNRYPLKKTPFFTFANERFLHFTIRRILSGKNPRYTSCLLYHPLDIADIYKLIDFQFKTIYIETTKEMGRFKESVCQNDMTKNVQIYEYDGSTPVNVVLSYKNYYHVLEKSSTLIIIGFSEEIDDTVPSGKMKTTCTENHVNVGNDENQMSFDIIKTETYTSLGYKLVKKNNFLSYHQEWTAYDEANILSTEGVFLYKNLHFFIFQK